MLGGKDRIAEHLCRPLYARLMGQVGVNNWWSDFLWLPVLENNGLQALEDWRGSRSFLQRTIWRAVECGRHSVLWLRWLFQW